MSFFSGFALHILLVSMVVKGVSLFLLGCLSCSVLKHMCVHDVFMVSSSLTQGFQMLIQPSVQLSLLLSLLLFLFLCTVHFFRSHTNGSLHCMLIFWTAVGHQPVSSCLLILYVFFSLFTVCRWRMRLPGFEQCSSTENEEFRLKLYLFVKHSALVAIVLNLSDGDRWCDVTNIPPAPLHLHDILPECLPLVCQWHVSMSLFV